MNKSKIIEWVLRIAVAGEFLGHGVFALQGKAQWVKWFSNFGVSDAALATKLLFIVCIMDLLVALIVLVKPLKPVLLWAAFWGFWTALVRPIVGIVTPPFDETKIRKAEDAKLAGDIRL